MNLGLVEDDCQIAGFRGRFTLHIDKLRSVRDRIENDDELRRQLQQDNAFLARWKLDRLDRYFIRERPTSSPGNSIPELQKTCLAYSQKESEFTSCAAILRTLGLTVKLTSTISSSVGS